MKNTPIGRFISLSPQDGEELAFPGEDASLKGGATKARYKGVWRGAKVKLFRIIASLTSWALAARLPSVTLILVGDGGLWGTSCADHFDNFLGESWGSKVAARGNDLVAAE